MLLKRIFIKDGKLKGVLEDNEEVSLGIPRPISEMFYTDAAKKGTKMIESWEKDIKRFRRKLVSMAREDNKKYYQIPKKPTTTSMYDIIFAYNTFTKNAR